MLMQGEMIRVTALGDGLYELVFDNQRRSVNTLSRACVTEFGDAITLLRAREDLRGLLISSDHESFIVGADVSEFLGFFRLPDEQLQALIGEMRSWLARLEALPVPTVVAINGEALGGGFELCLACDFRVMARGARAGQPEVRLGLLPGWGATVRLPRLIGLDHAIDWICSGRQVEAQEALAQGAVDACVEPAQLRHAALDLLQRAVRGEFDVTSRRARKQQPVPLTKLALTLATESARGVIAAKSGPHYPAPMLALDTLRQQAHLSATEAMPLELDAFIRLVRSDAALALVSLFLKEQKVKQIARRAAGSEASIQRPGIVGAGVMGGAIACQTALKLGPVVMKDVRATALQQGMEEAARTLASRVRRGQLDPEQRVRILSGITPTLGFEEFAGADLVIEAVVEDPGVKSRVLAEVETRLTSDVIIASNTSAIPISVLARSLRHPERFCGIHFFNPVSRMQLVEIVRGEKTSQATISRALGFARSLGKTPVVVRDGPGFLVNRVLFAYLLGFSLLLRDGVEFQRIDTLMETYGWPLGPARLLDVIGLDIARNASRMMAAGYPERMTFPGESVIDRLCALRRLGQKNGKGFYLYRSDDARKPRRDPELHDQIADLTGTGRAVSDEQIVERLMIPLLIETARALEEHVIGSPAEADLALVLGIGYPPFRGGPFYTLDRWGLARFVARCNQYRSLGALYEPTQQMRELAMAGRDYTDLTREVRA